GCGTANAFSAVHHFGPNGLGRVRPADPFDPILSRIARATDPTGVVADGTVGDAIVFHRLNVEVDHRFDQLNRLRALNGDHRGGSGNVVEFGVVSADLLREPIDDLLAIAGVDDHHERGPISASVFPS